MKFNGKDINWGPALFLIIYQVLLLATLPIYFYYNGLPSWGLVIVSLILLYLTGLSITAGYHRFYSHRTYRTNKFVEAIFLFFASMSGQGSALRWGFDHRLHHAHVDTDEDPYSVKRGFWYAHFLWILEKPKEIERRIVPDLMNNPLVMFQHNHIGKCMLFSNVIVCFIISFLFKDFWGAFFIASWLRLFVLHHFTWFINSLAHTWGDRPFSQEQSAVDNYIISLLTFGEGYHNYHHTFANDYRNGIRWFHFDPTKWLIWSLQKLKLAKDLKKMNQDTIKRKMVLEHKDLLLEQITNYWTTKKEELEKQVNDIASSLVLKMANFNQLKEQYSKLKKEHVTPDLLRSIKREIKSLKKSLHHDWKQWSMLSKTILYRRPLLTN